MKRLFLILAIGFASPSPLQAQANGDAARGRALAQNVCAVCHAVRKDQIMSPNADAPTFAELAKLRGMSARALAVALRTSHRTMPNLVLEDDEVRDVSVYILSLK
jgi:mono/diheme cytochrome c family protein